VIESQCRRERRTVAAPAWRPIFNQRFLSGEYSPELHWRRLRFLIGFFNHAPNFHEVLQTVLKTCVVRGESRTEPGFGFDW